MSTARPHGKKTRSIVTMLFKYDVGLLYKVSGWLQKGYNYKNINLWETTTHEVKYNV
jgi:hypothetical protein